MLDIRVPALVACSSERELTTAARLRRDVARFVNAIAWKGEESDAVLQIQGRRYRNHQPGN